MAKKHGPEATKTWVHLSDEGAHLFDQTNGMAAAEETPERETGVSDEQRIADAAVIGNGWSTMAGGGL